ncbi:MAG: V-type ATP synthase subunit F [archaeon]
MEICALGSSEFVLGFKLCGVKKYAIVNDNNFVQKYEELVNDADVGVLIMEEHYANCLPMHMKKKAEQEMTPMVVPISDAGSGGDLRKLIKRCLGIDLWKDKDIQKGGSKDEQQS